MPVTDGLARFLTDVLEYATFRSHVHKAEDGLDGFGEADLGYAAVSGMALDWQDPWRPGCVQTPRRILMHTTFAAHHYSNGLAGVSGAERSAEWIPTHLGADAEDAGALAEHLREAQALLCDRVAGLGDADLAQPARETWDGKASKALVALVGGILHPAWHLGQLAMLHDWRAVEETGHTLTPPAGPPGESVYQLSYEPPAPDLDTRHDILLTLARRAYAESPTDGIRNIVEGMSEAEMVWRPGPDIENPWFCRASWVIVTHTWSPKIVYLDHALGERKLGYGEGDSEVSGCGWGVTDPAVQLRAIDRAHGWLVDHVEAASDEDLDRVNPMHIDHPMTGWQAVVCMAQHDAWHAGQLSVMRDAYRAMWET